MIGGLQVTLEHVEARRAEVTQHIVSRQPISTAISASRPIVVVEATPGRR